MIKTIQTVILITALLLLAWVLPWCYGFLTAQPSRSPFTLYSPVTHCFACVDYQDDGRIAGRDFRGNAYTASQFDSILPMFYYRQLAAEGRFPSRIEGVPVTPRDAERTGFMFRSSPAEIARPATGLYRLLESMPERVDFKAPTDVFRITDTGIEFVNMETNTPDKQKSAAFTRVLASKGFTFPARIVAGNPTTRKEYDNGCLLVDDALRLFHLKQVRGRPFVRAVPIPDSLRVARIFVTEYADRKLLGLLSAEDGGFYALSANDYGLHEIPVGGYDPFRESMMILGDRFYWTVNVDGEGGECLYAVDARGYSLTDDYVYEDVAGKWERREAYLFPFTLAFTSPLDGYVKPRLGGFSVQALWLGLVLAVSYAFLHRRTLRRRWLQTAAIVPFGLFLFIPLLVLGQRR